MNGLRENGTVLARALIARIKETPPACEVLVCPPSTLIGALASLGESGLQLGGQDCSAQGLGAHTGDIAAPMLADFGCRYVVVGHSERRSDHGETNKLVKAKSQAALSAGLIPIVCVGESLTQREQGLTDDVIRQQVSRSVPTISGDETFVLAYEPVWAIGTGLTPTIEQIAEVHGNIRNQLIRRFGARGGQIRLLYGGSVKPSNAASILAVDHVNGALVGGASLNADDFWAICEAAH